MALGGNIFFLLGGNIIYCNMQHAEEVCIVQPNFNSAMNVANTLENIANAFGNNYITL